MSPRLTGSSSPTAEVTVITDCDLVHSSYIMAGLLDLEQEGWVRIRYRLPVSTFFRYRGRSTVLIEVQRPRSRSARKVCLDVHDSSRYLAQSTLQHADVYFKRSYRPEHLSEVPEVLRGKIRPFGLWFPCRSASDRCGGRRWLGSGLAALARGGWRKLLPGREGAYHVHNAFMGRYRQYQSRCLALEYERPVTAEPMQARVYFNTRLWAEDCGDPNWQELNRQRLELVRRLRRSLDSAFLGGIFPPNEVPAGYEDCRSTAASTRQAHLASIHSSLVCVYTNGLNGSIASKLGEYFAAGRCVVGEPLQNLVDPPLAEGLHLFTFRSPDDCVRVCQGLLADPDRPTRVGKEARRYYERHVRPAAHLRELLNQVLDEGPDA